MGGRFDLTKMRDRRCSTLGTLKLRGNPGRLMQQLLQFLTQPGDATLHGEDSSLKNQPPFFLNSPSLTDSNQFSY